LIIREQGQKGKCVATFGDLSMGPILKTLLAFCSLEAEALFLAEKKSGSPLEASKVERRFWRAVTGL
jgi:hypothetical protein